MSPSLLVEFTVNFTLRVIPIFWGVERGAATFLIFRIVAAVYANLPWGSKSKVGGGERGGVHEAAGALSDSAV